MLNGPTAGRRVSGHNIRKLAPQMCVSVQSVEVCDGGWFIIAVIILDLHQTN